MKVLSLLPSATELVCAAGGEACLVGRSHECDYPPSIRDRPILTAAKNKFQSMSQMNDAVTASLGAGEGLYSIDKDLLLQLNPDVIVTQSLCEVCSVDLALVERICAKALPSANIISLNPFTIEEVLEDVQRVGTAMQQEAAAQAAVEDMQRRIDTAKAFVSNQPPLKLNNVSVPAAGGVASSKS
jgi:ABC-type Fe3+-hydroxamate transport system substrate-binding protein